ncbi:MAG: phenylalanine--tRNA ligase subunit beta [Clostridia bacterium]|nr:phenylalanine--tRNA ligase subunit beta [Clostridia bacterium]
MRVSYKWLKEYVDLSQTTPQELADKMTMSGVAVEHLEDLGEGIKNIVTGRLAKIEKHPDADKLQICQVDAGTGELLQIVTGAANVREGQVVPVALVGAELPSGLKIKRSKLRGVESLGMLCSGKELGLDEKSLAEESQGGILILPADTPIGKDIKEVLGLDDVVLELELTPNRADCLSMVGVAQEVAAVLGVEFHPPMIEVKETEDNIEGLARVDIVDTDLCKRYVARIFRNVKTAPSPQWMQQRLRAAGMRPISNIVDITNYVMLEMGQPLHAFDYDTLGGQQIIVRRAVPGEELVTLDNSVRKLEPEMLVIADAKAPVGLAGVMGGLDSEVTDETKTILLESAYFDGACIRRTSRKLGLGSEASKRFEKGIDLGGCVRAADRAAQLMVELGAGEIVRGVIDICVTSVEDKVINLSLERVGLILGIEIPKDNVVNILKGLGFGVEDQGAQLVVKVPTRRNDITLEEDLVEEVARLYGYNNIPTTLPDGPTTQGARTYGQQVHDLIRKTILSCGLTEVLTLSFSNQKLLDNLRIPQDDSQRRAVVLQNPLSEEQNMLRTTLIPGLLEVTARNFARRVKDIAIFELGNTFEPTTEGKLPVEHLTLAGMALGQTAQNWQGKPVTMDFYYLKGIVEALFTALGLTGVSYAAEKSNPSFHPGRTAKVLVKGEEIGIIGQLHPDVAENFDLSGEVYAFQLAADKLVEKADLVKKYRSLPRFPGMERDMAFVVARDVEAARILEIIRANGGDLLQDVTIFDLYQGQQIKEGYKSMAFSLKYQAPDRTLTDEEVNQVQAGIEAKLAEEVGAQLRG